MQYLFINTGGFYYFVPKGTTNFIFTFVQKTI